MMCRMWKQMGGFALFGAIVATLGVSVAQGLSTRSGQTFVVYTGDYALVGSDGTAWTPFAVAAAAGAALGTVVGAALWLLNIRFVAHPSGGVAGVVSAGIAGIVIGLSPVLWLLAETFDGRSAGPPVSPLLVYAVSAAVAYALALTLVYAVLRGSRDVRTGRTVRAVAATLPVGAVAATALGVGIAGLHDYRTEIATSVAVIVPVALVLAGTLAAARKWACKPSPGSGDLPPP